MCVVQVPRSVQRHTDFKLVRCKEVAPLRRQECTVGLHGMPRYPATFQNLIDDFYSSLIIVDTNGQRLSRMPENIDFSLVADQARSNNRHK